MTAVPTARDVARSLRRSILSGELAPGERLVERQLAAQLQVSRALVREAIHRLAAEGLAEASPNRGARVVELASHEINDLFEVRRSLLGLVARLAVLRGEDAELALVRQRLEQLIGLIEGDGGPEQIIEANNVFGAALAQAAHSADAARMLRQAYRKAAWHYAHLGGMHRPDFVPGPNELRDLSAALAERDVAGAERAAQRLIELQQAKAQRHLAEHGVLTLKRADQR